MDFSEEYRQKLVSADEAVKVIKSGDWVDYGWCVGTVDALDKALAKRTDELKDINLRGGIVLKPLAVFERSGMPGRCGDVPGFPDGFPRLLQLRTERFAHERRVRAREIYHCGGQ
jgi:hypothetical protein